ncbi:MAG: AAA family ATPase [Clostridiales Family XIII bacterium]|jgi:predicted AAA+ superfamily ATPase|nr:AAA family ATPase [Clostridiales Family XIII bacterium]
MLYRKIYDELNKWRNSNLKKALLLTGARQIGKTYLIRKFGESNYDNFLEINFITQPKAAAIFSGNLDIETLIVGLTAYLRKPLVQGKTLVFLDEIQECPNARTAIKFLVEDGRFDYIESGSLLGVNYKEVPSYPVGYEEILQMYPMDFEEFSLANGVPTGTLATIKNAYEHKEPVNEAVHQTMMTLFRYYVIVGGMPEVVQKFVDTHDIGEVVKLQKDILSLYRQDITKYSKESKNRIKDIFDRIPAELNTQNRRFMLSDISKSARMNRYESSFLWLKDAGVALPCYNITEPKAPLMLNEKSSLFRLYLSDTGLLCAASMENVQFSILAGDLDVNMGSILENTFAQLLTSANFELRYMNKKGIGEIDFVLQRGAEIILTEIKSGVDYTIHSAINNVLDVGDWDIQHAYVFCDGNIQSTNKITYLPWYTIMFFSQETMPDHLIVDVKLP